MEGHGHALAIGSTFGGRYRIDRALGAGGMGYVYAAHDTLLRRPVALKVVRAAEDDDEGVARERSARLLREARAAAALRHPNAVAVFDVGESDGVPFIAMELVTGRTLGSFMNNATLRAEIPNAQKLGWLLGTARALAAAHKEGIVHRDIKPENIMVCDDGSVKVLDFGIAKRANQNSSSSSSPYGTDGPASFKTAEGVVTGTPRYMSPEQLLGGTLDGRTDQFAWGILAYELLAGVHPQTTTGTAERWAAPPQALTKVTNQSTETISQIIMRCLERWPEHRWPSMDDVVRALESELGTANTTQPIPTTTTTTTTQDASTAQAPLAEPTMRFDTRGAPIAQASPLPEPTTRVDGQLQTAADAVAIKREAVTDAASLLPKTITGARVGDAQRPTWRRLIVPLVGLAFMFFGLIDMLRVVVAQGGEQAPELGKGLIRVGWIIIFLAPLSLLLRHSRTGATLLLRPFSDEHAAAKTPRHRPPPLRSAGLVHQARLSIRRARGMNQSLSPSDVVGASAATMQDGTASVLLMPKRSGTSLPILLTSFTEAESQSILTALGITHARALTGILSFPLRRGAFDVFRLVIAISWRVGIVLTYAPITSVYLLGFAVSVLTGLIAIGLVFAPVTGPHLELTPEQLRVIGSGDPHGDRVVALRDLAECVATESQIELRLRSGDTVRLHAPKALFSRRSMSIEERTHFVVHVNAAVARVRVAWS